MKKRLTTSILIVVITILAIISKLLPLTIGDYIFDVFVLFICIISGMEISNIMQKMNRDVNKFLTSMYGIFNYIVFLICHTKVQFSLIVGIQLISLAIYFVITLIVEAIKNKSQTFKSHLIVSLNTVIACMYPTFWLGLLININHMDYYAGNKYCSLIFVVLPFAITWLTDTFAYLVGSRLKGPKLAPSISPNKTISGAIGGLIGGVLGSMLVFCLLTNVGYLSGILVIFGLSWWHFLLFGILGSVLGQIGDLFESKLKRLAKIKDSGDIFPGHGGMLDRIDALTFVVFFIYVILAIMLI